MILFADRPEDLELEARQEELEEAEELENVARIDGPDLSREEIRATRAA
ncbi:MAG: hypothetical protein KC917_05980 [Candidatus Omnitrophica bacterium]|nr:hypothetical protein [Candidatus Omnitrophota bacterium]MCA9428698.1 hypothetical protein [Candidatus Omnitrophota bacterium]MCB9784176.1 hypothetical protein [Candidatus Omnitrophota bacterium]